VTVVVDSTMVLAFMAADDRHHRTAVSFLNDTDEDLITTPLVVAALDRQVTEIGGADAAKALWADIASGAYTVRWWADAMDETIKIARSSPTTGLTDASLVALCRRLRTNRIATFASHFETFDLTLLPERT